MEQLIIQESSKTLIHAVVGIKSGWRHEEAGKKGITHFLEHAIFLGNKSHPTPDDEVVKYGVQLNGMTLPEYTLFFFTSAKEDFTKNLRLFLSLIFHPKFNKTKLEKEKQENIIAAVIQGSDFTPWELAHECAKNLIFYWDIMTSLGAKEDIKLLTKEDLVVWHRKYYHAKNSFIVTYGDIGENEISKLIKDANIPSDGEIPSPFNIQYDKREIFIKREGMKNVEMVYGFKLPQYNIGWEILQIILGNYPTSRIWGEEFSRLTYCVGSQLNWTTTGCGFFLYFGATSIDEACEIDKDLWQLLDNLEIKERDLELAKKIRTIEILKMKEGGERGLLKFISSNPLLMYGNYKEMIEKINQINKEEVLVLAERLLNKENAVKIMVGAKK